MSLSLDEKVIPIGIKSIRYEQLPDVYMKSMPIGIKGIRYEQLPNVFINSEISLDVDIDLWIRLFI